MNGLVSTIAIRPHKTLAKIMVISASIIGVLLIVAGALLLLISLMIPMFTALGLTSAAAWIAMLGPIGLIIAGIVALVAITVLMVKHWDTIKQKAIQIWGAIKDTIKKNWDIILAILFPGVGIAVLIARRWGAIKNVITGILSKITSVVIDFAATLKEILFGLLGVKFFSDLFDNIFGGFLGLKNRLSGALRRVGGGTGGANGGGGTEGQPWYEDIKDFVLDRFKWPGWKDFLWPFSDLSVWLWGKFKWPGWKDFSWPFSDLSVWLWGKFKWPGWKDFLWPFSDLSVWLWGKFKWPGWKDFLWPFSDLSVWLWGKFKWPGWKDFSWPFSDLSVWLWGKFKWPWVERLPLAV